MAEAQIIPMEGRRAGERARCSATTVSGRPCRNNALPGHSYCRAHFEKSAPPRKASSPAPPAGRTGSGFAGFVQRRLSGAYSVDDFGFDPELFHEVLTPLTHPLYERYFRVRTIGIGRIPVSGPALVVANHSGAIALDSVMVQHAVASEHPAHRVVRNIGADLVYRLPFIGPLARKAGNAVACDEDALELLRRGELVGVYPEGFKGVGKGWSERYRLQRFGRGGFVQIALKAQVPIIPVAVVGAEEAYPMIGNAGVLASLFGFPYFPVTPTFPLLGPLGLLPLPSKWIIEFGEPMAMDDYPDDAAEDSMLVFDLADAVRDRIQQMLFKNLQVRGGTFV
jgi:1-acyl-sn-glycerol-3-phosphate acyltransferase